MAMLKPFSDKTVINTYTGGVMKMPPWMTIEKFGKMPVGKTLPKVQLSL